MLSAFSRTLTNPYLRTKTHPLFQPPLPTTLTPPLLAPSDTEQQYTAYAQCVDLKVRS